MLFRRKSMQALTKLDVCTATLWINWCLKDWCTDFCHCLRIIDSELCLDDYVKTRKIKLSLKEERMAKKECQVLCKHTKLACTFKEAVTSWRLSYTFEIDFLKKGQLLLEQYMSICKIKTKVKN